MPLSPRTSPSSTRAWQRLYDSPLDDFLRRANLFAKAIRSSELLGWTLAAATLAVLAAVVSDAFFAWPAAVRIAMAIAGALGLLLAGGLLLARLFGGRYDARRMARLTEQRLSRSDSLLINAVEFRSGTEIGSAALRASVVNSADAVVTELAATGVTPASPAVRAALAGLAAVVLFCGAFLAAPRLFAAVIPRFLDPHGDHPPFTLLHFEPTVSPDPLHRGRSALVVVEITGPELVEEATLVLRSVGDSADAWDRVPLFRQSETSFSSQLASVDHDLEFHVATPRGRSGWFDLKLSPVPLIEDARATLTAPAYTSRPPREQPLDDRGLRGLRGTDCQLEVHSNQQLSHGELTLFSAGDPQFGIVVRLTTATDDATTVQGRFSIENTGRFELRLLTASGVASDVLAGPIVAEPDRAPHVRITTPAETLIAVEGWKVPVEIQATDDVGISRIRLFRGVNGWSPAPATLAHHTDSAGVALATSEFDLAALGAKAGDLIRYYASADDHAPGSPQSMDSPTQTIQVISEDEYRDFARQQYQLAELTEEFESFRNELDRLNDQRQQALEQLEELLKKQAAGESPTEAEREQRDRLEQQLRDFARDTAELARTLRERAADMQLYDLEQNYTQELERLAKELDGQAQAAEDVAELMKQQRTAPSPALSEALQEAADRLLKQPGPFDRERQDELGQMSDDLQTLQKMDALNEQVDRLQAVSAQQRELANRLSELAGSNSLTPDEQARADQFAKEQELLAQELESIQQQLRESAEAAADDLPQMAESARKLAEMLDQLAIPQEQLSAAQQARNHQGDAAYQHAEAAARKLESLAEAAGEAQNASEAGSGLDRPLGMSRRQLSNSLQQLRRGRRPPGLGQRSQKGGASPGQTDGDGQGGGLAGGQASGSEGRLRPGQSSSRGDNNAQVLGPRTQELVESSDKSATMQADGTGRWIRPGSSGDAPVIESLSTSPQSREGVSGSNLRGVPVGYRDAAEAYLRRLSEEKRSK